jgi:hypothetical protein
VKEGFATPRDALGAAPRGGEGVVQLHCCSIEGHCVCGRIPYIFDDVVDGGRG